jgi:hypothetical protein
VSLVVFDLNCDRTHFPGACRPAAPAPSRCVLIYMCTYPMMSEGERSLDSLHPYIFISDDDWRTKFPGCLNPPINPNLPTNPITHPSTAHHPSLPPSSPTPVILFLLNCDCPCQRILIPVAIRDVWSIDSLPYDEARTRRMFDTNKEYVLLLLCVLQYLSFSHLTLL